MEFIGQTLVASDVIGCRLKWPASSEPDVKGYNVYMSKWSNEHFQKMTAQPIEQTDWLSPPLRTDMAYYFYVQAVDYAGNESAPSNVFGFQTEFETNEPPPPETGDLVVAPASETEEMPAGEEEEDFMTTFGVGGE